MTGEQIKWHHANLECNKQSWEIKFGSDCSRSDLSLMVDNHFCHKQFRPIVPILYNAFQHEVYLQNIDANDELNILHLVNLMLALTVDVMRRY